MMNAGPRATAAFLVVTGLLFAALLMALGWRARAAGLASWVLAISVIVAATTVLLAAAFAKGMTEGRL
jgi:hypothetical protein